MADTIKITLWIESTYETGHECNRTVHLKVDPPTGDVDAWLEKIGWEHTGCDCTPYEGSSDCGSVYEVRVTDADDPALIGATYEWNG